MSLGVRDHIFPTWYFSPMPAQFQNLETLWVCPNCLSFFVEEWAITQHLSNELWAEGQTINCQRNHKRGLVVPPGNEIYRDDKLSVFEILGGSAGIFDKK